jgi:hypothetical protein
MYQSSPRNNFLDILIDPTTVAILGSIALHATMGAYVLPILTQPPRDSKKAEPITVKVVELTPNELQRIPQAPAPILTPSPPVLAPTTPTLPTTPSVATSPQTIPASPIRTTPPPKISTPPKGKKSQTPIPQTQPTAPIFNPDISFKPSPKPSESPQKKNQPLPSTSSPPVQSSQTPTSSPGSSTPTATSGTNDPGNSPTSQTATPATTTPQPSPTSPSPTTPSPSLSPRSGGNVNLYGEYTKAANNQLQEYLNKYPNLKPYPPETIKRKYPPGVACSKVKPLPFIVLMVVFGPVSNSPDSDILGTSSAPANEIKVFKDETNSENIKLGNQIAIDAALTQANTADQNRSEADKGKPILHQYRVEFDPASCKN